MYKAIHNIRIPMLEAKYLTRGTRRFHLLIIINLKKLIIVYAGP
jgi:hypothetical protein